MVEKKTGISHLLFQLEPQFRLFQWINSGAPLTDDVNTEDRTISFKTIASSNSDNNSPYLIGDEEGKGPSLYNYRVSLDLYGYSVLPLILKLKPQNLNTEIHGGQLPYITTEMKSLEVQLPGLAWVQRTFNFSFLSPSLSPSTTAIY